MLQGVQTEFYGLLAWGIISRISLPLLIFYRSSSISRVFSSSLITLLLSRFHSCVVLVEIWKNTYRTKEIL